MPHPPRPSLTLAIEVPDHHGLAAAFAGARCLLAKHRADGCGDVWVMDYRPLSAQRHVRVGGFAPVDTAQEVAA
jgi:hypothetical protein